MYAQRQAVVGHDAQHTLWIGWCVSAGDQATFAISVKPSYVLIKRPHPRIIDDLLFRK